MTERRFLIWFFGTAVVGAAVTALLAILVDPYLVFDRPRLKGLNHIKPAVGTNEPMMKAHQATRAIAQTVILGSSRAGVGLDPEAPEWPPSMQPVYNLAIVGSALDEHLQYLQLLLSADRGSGGIGLRGLLVASRNKHGATAAQAGQPTGQIERFGAAQGRRWVDCAQDCAVGHGSRKPDIGRPARHRFDVRCELVRTGH